MDPRHSNAGDVFGHDYNASGKSVNFDAMHAGNMLVQARNTESRFFPSCASKRS